MAIIPVISGGGSGTRLWPLSRRCRPKQFLHWAGGPSLFQQAVLRCRQPAFDPRPIIVGARQHRFLIAEQLTAVGTAADILLEPTGRDSCAAIAAASLHALSRSPDALVLAMACDHRIPDAAAFGRVAAAAATLAEAGRIVTFGVRPERAETGYGYIAPGRCLGAGLEVEQFVEKPDAAEAARFVAEGWLWNSGNFLFRARTFLAELERLAPRLLAAVERAYRGARADLGFLRLDEAAFAGAPALAVDRAVLERTGRAAVVPVAYRWDDFGDWAAVARGLASDRHGNAIAGEARVVGGRNNLVHSADRLTALVGVDDMVVVSTRDCLLVVPRERAQEVAGLVERLRREGRPQADESHQVFRPWGSYERLDAGDGYQVKQIAVRPGGTLSLQSHMRRAEHWVVVAGRVEATVGRTTRMLGPGQSADVPPATRHRLANRGNRMALIIEVQTGSYLGEDDILRHDDAYGRVEGSEHDRA